MRYAAALFLMFANASAARADPIDDWAEATLADQRIPGMAVGLFCKGEAIKTGTYGFANLEHHVLVTEDTLFQTASVGKQFTAALIQLLAREGRLSLDDPISRYLPGTRADWSAITIRHLLTHTSGIPDYENDFDLRRDWSEEQLVETFLKLDLDFAPGTKFAYSNTGYVLLGAIARAAGGAYWGDLAEAKIFDPAGMTSAQVIDDVALVKHRAAGYNLKDGKIVNQWWVSPGLNRTADGAVYVSIKDMAAWEHALATRRILDDAELDEAWTSATDAAGQPVHYGFGWGMDEKDGRKRIGHTGSWQGFNALISREPATGRSLVLLANRDGLDLAALLASLETAAGPCPD